MRVEEEQFVDGAVASLEGNAELQMAARAELQAEISPQAEVVDLNEATRRLQHAPKGAWRRILAGVVLVTSIPILFASILGTLVELAELRKSLGSFRSAPDPERQWRGLKRSMTEEQRLLMFGKAGASSEDERWKGLWLSEPENPAFYLEYATAFLAEHDRLPDGFVAKGQEIDAGNGWYALLAAAVLTEPAIERVQLSKRDRDAGVLPTWTVKDEEAVEEAARLFRAAASEPRLESYRREMNHRRFELLPEPSDFVGGLPNIAYLANQSADGFRIRHALELVAVEANRLAEAGDKQGFRELSEDYQRVTRRQVEEAGTLIDGLIAQSGMKMLLPVLRDVGARLMVDDEDLDAVAGRMESRMEALKERRSQGDEGLVAKHGSMMAGLSLPLLDRQVLDPPELTKAGLLPGCRVDRALLDRMLSGAAWLLLGLAACVAIGGRAFNGELAKRLSGGLSGLLSRSDFLWILIPGVVAPVLIYLGLRYLTPLGRLDWGPRMTFFVGPIGQFLCLLLMLLSWPLVLVRLRLGAAAKVLEWVPGRPWVGGLVALCPLAAMVLLGLAVPFHGGTMLLLGSAACLAGITLVWLLGAACLRYFGGRQACLKRACVADAVVPAYLLGMLMMGLLVPIFHAEEKRWYARDELMLLTPNLTSYESQVAECMRRELLEVFDGP